MAKMRWLKLHIDILDDPKLASFTGDQFRVFILLLCLARDSEEPGIIKLSPVEISWRIRRPVEEIESTLELCQQGDRPIIEAFEGGFCFVKFLDRQYENPSDLPDATRQRKQRQRDKIKGHDDVTTMSRQGHEIDTDPETDPETEEINKNTPFEFAINEFKKHRQKIRAPLTDYAIELLQKKLEKLAPGDDEEKIKVLNQSISNGWRDVFALKDKESPRKARGKPTKTPSEAEQRQNDIYKSLYVSNNPLEPDS